MLVLFDTERETYTFPDGSVLTIAEMKESNNYNIMFAKTCVIDLVDGVLTSYQTLADMANTYGIEYSTDDEQDPQEVLDQVLAKKQCLKENPPLTITDTVLKAASFAALSFTDEQALEVPDLYPVWAPNTEYEQNERITYNGQLYKVAQKHTSQDTDGWRPGESGSAALYSAVTIGSSGHDQWKMPTGAHDAYNMDDIVEYNGKLYQSKMDGNTTIPGQSRFWVEYTE